MCAIAGYIKPGGFAATILRGMIGRAAHRGPDGEAYWLRGDADRRGRIVDRPTGLDGQPPTRAGLGHRRLAIIDLSPNGLQPMECGEGRYWIVFNGEIYNFVELRQELEGLGHTFRSRSDTEVVLEAFAEWGSACFARFNGMWGMAIVDTQVGTLTLSRDRLGEKPLYLWQGGGAFAFASEIKQFLDLPGFEARTNEDAVAEYVDTGYEAPPQTFFRGVSAFPAGCWATIRLEAPSEPAPQSYWEPEEIAASGIDREEAAATLRMLFTDAVRLRLRSDVPIGTCLSGGLDSTAILMQIAQLHDGRSPRHTLSAVFDDPRVDERRYIAAALARFGGIDHQVSPTPQMFLHEQDAFIYQHDEPPGSLSLFAGSCVMRLAREHGVPVLLNGQGADELFGGYWPAYFLWLHATLASRPLALSAHLLGAALPGGNPEIFRQALPHWRQYRARQARRNRSLLRPRYREAGFTLNRNWAAEAQSLSPAAYRMNEIRRVHLPRLLKWEDRNSMAHSIEGRYPFLDYRLLEWGVSLPPGLNFHRGWNKWLLREAFGDRLPAIIRYRRDKIGFETPQAAWMTHDLRPHFLEWAAHPSERFTEVVDVRALRDLVPQVVNHEVHRMDEKHLVLLRLFFLDRWLNVFGVQ